MMPSFLPPSSITFTVLAMVSVNLIIFGICVCRLRLMRNVLWRVKFQYWVGCVASMANGFSPLFFQQWPNNVTLFFTAWVCLMLWLDGYQWRRGPPEASNSTKADL